MTGGRPQFAVVREDPELLRAVVDRTPARRLLLVGSGGCSALCARLWWPQAEIALVEPNPAQRQRIEAKVTALRSAVGDTDPELLRRFNVGAEDRCELSQDGNFEGLFRGLRSFVEEFVADPETIASWFESTAATPDSMPGSMQVALHNPYWPVAFELFFHDSLLETMFGPAATQHAAPGSYPEYFRRRIEGGLRRPDRVDNYFLHHIFLGRYLDGARPPFLAEIPPLDREFVWIEDELAAVETFSGYDVVDLSNVLDWTDAADARPLAQRIGTELDPGSFVVWRQLNNRRQREAWFGDQIVFDDALGRQLADADRSLFYESVHVGRRAPTNPGPLDN